MADTYHDEINELHKSARELSLVVKYVEEKLRSRPTSPFEKVVTTRAISPPNIPMTPEQKKEVYDTQKAFHKGDQTALYTEQQRKLASLEIVNDILNRTINLTGEIQKALHNYYDKNNETSNTWMEHLEIFKQKYETARDNEIPDATNEGLVEKTEAIFLYTQIIQSLEKLINVILAPEADPATRLTASSHSPRLK